VEAFGKHREGQVSYLPFPPLPKIVGLFPTSWFTLIFAEALQYLNSTIHHEWRADPKIDVQLLRFSFAAFAMREFVKKRTFS
jgi:hypothetical protein